MVDAPRTKRRWWATALKLAIVVAVSVAVSGTVEHAIAKLGEQEWSVHMPWLVLAGVFYVVGMLPMAWFWQRILVAFGSRPGWFTTLYAYFVGHLGKYVPGKALVVVIRAGIVNKKVDFIRLAVLSVFIETLTMMAVGSALAAVFAAREFPHERWLIALAVLSAIAAAAPTLPPIARWLAGRAIALREFIGRRSEGASATVEVVKRAMTWKLFCEGWIAGAICWEFMGLSLWATLKGIGVTSLHGIHDLPLLVAVVAIAVVAGFISMLPGGLVVRDALLLQLLSPVCGEADALVATVLLRLVWLMAEVAFCAILEIAKRSRLAAPISEARPPKSEP